MRVMLWGIVVVLALLLLGALLLWMRRRYHSLPSRRESAEAGFSIGGLESLRRNAQITREEFKRLRRLALGLDRGPEEKDNPTSSPPMKDDDGNIARKEMGPSSDEDQE